MIDTHFKPTRTPQDYYVSTYLRGNANRKRETDTHWRSKTGSAEWNYRHKHRVKVPIESAEATDLCLEMWDKDIVGANDSLGNAVYRLHDWLKKCYVEQRSIKPLQLIKSHQNAFASAVDDTQPVVMDRGGRTVGGGHGDDEGGSAVGSNYSQTDHSAGGGGTTSIPMTATTNPLSGEGGIFMDDLVQLEDEYAVMLGNDGDGNGDSDDGDSAGEDDELLEGKKQKVVLYVVASVSNSDT